MHARAALWNDDIDTALRTAAALRAIGDPLGAGLKTIRAWWCARVLEAGAAALRDAPDARSNVVTRPG
jgi:hypothetical protein